MTVRRVDPAALTLARLVTYDPFKLGTVKFVVPTPDARIQVNVSVLGYTDDGADRADNWLGWNSISGTPLLTIGLYLGAAIRTPLGTLITVTDLFGTAGGDVAPMALAGYAQTVLADCDAVVGNLVIAGPGHSLAGGSETAPPPLTFVLRTRYQAVVPLCDDEWHEIASKCSPSLAGPAAQW